MEILKWILPILGTWFYEEATGNALPPKPEDRICKDVSLADSEIDELVGEFNRQPYLTPILAEPVCAYDGILWIHIKIYRTRFKICKSSTKRFKAPDRKHSKRVLSEASASSKY